jgi:aspartyl-tRNA(Asn)/glutamyl-tRNA(Gln) amidotransferase subunit A
MAGQALADARTAADEIANGNYRGPLHGVPIGVKDLCSTAGVRTTAGSAVLEDWVPDEDATVVRKLREAGAIIVGKTNLHPWAFGATGINEHFGTARNPWDTDRITGGSSSGSGTGVAAGLCFAALGSDTGGSIRIPASLCGIAGIKQTYGRVSLHGVVPLSWSLDHVGPMARSVRDCALVLEAISGRDPQDPSTVDMPVDAWSEHLDESLEGLRIAVPDYGFNDIEDDVATKVRDAISALERLGATFIEIELPVLRDYWRAATQVLLSEAATYHKETAEKEPERFDESIRERIQGGLQMKATDYVHAARLRDETRRGAADTLFGHADLLALPATRMTAATIESVTSEDPTLGLTLMTAPFDLTGQPAISVPCGLTDAGLPVGLQLVGRMFDERTVLRAAHIFETQSGIPMPHPPVD